MRAMLAGALLLIPHLAMAQTLGLVWDFPRSYQPTPASFHISYTSSAAPEAIIDEMTVPPSAPGACATFGSTDADTYCALWPTCPTPGTIMIFWVQAVWGSETSDRSNIALCHFTRERPCECQDPGRDVPPPPTPPVPPVPLPPPPPLVFQFTAPAGST